MTFKTLITLLVITAVCVPLYSAPKKTKPAAKADLIITEQTNLEDAVLKLLPKNSKLKHSVTKGIFGPADGTKGPNINVIYSASGKTPEIMILTPVENGKYKKIKSAALNFGGKNSVEVQSVFFDQADKDSVRELFVLCYITGKKESFYATAVFDWNGKEFKRVSKIEPKLKGAYPAINVRKALRAIPGLQ
jgi:hypothetical protein